MLPLQGVDEALPKWKLHWGHIMAEIFGKPGAELQTQTNYEHVETYSRSILTVAHNQ